MPPDPTLASAAALLRSAGWIVTEPAGAGIPRVEAGQLWRGDAASDTRRVRSIDGRQIIYSVEGVSWPCSASCFSWNAWARKSGARPVKE